MKKMIFIIAIMFIALQVNAQSTTVDTARLLTELKFEKYLTGIILIQGKIDHHSDTLTFILDTGSSGISLDSATCEKLQLENRLTDTFVSGVGGKRKVRFSFRHQLNLNNLVIDSLDFHINDYSFLKRISGIPIDGIIGYSFLKKYIVAIDYEASMMQIYTPGIIDYPKNSYVFKPDIVPIPIVKASIIDNLHFDANFFFDTGAKMELIVTKRFAEANRFFRKKRKPCFVSVEGVSGTEYMPLTVIKEMQIGPYKFKNVPTYIFDDVNNLTAYPHNSGLIGSGIFSKFNLILNFPNGEICMKPNTGFNESFDYSYTGLSIYEDQHRIIVYDIAPESPAALAGLKVDDEIISVDDVMFNHLDDYRDAIGKRNTFIKLTIRRGTKTENLLMKTGSII